MKKKQVEIVVANATKLDGTGAVVVTIDPQFADFCQDVFEELHRILGHERIAVFPLPSGAIKFYSVKAKPEMITMSIDPAAIGGDFTATVDVDKSTKKTGKPTVVLNQWELIRNHMTQDTVLRGRTLGHPRFDDGTLVTTSSIVSDFFETPRKGQAVETKNTIYILGDK